MKISIKFLFFSVLISCFACSKKTTITNITETHYVVNSNVVDSSIYKAINPYKKAHDEQMYIVLAKSEDALIKADVESTLGNFFCDIIMDTFKTDCVLINSGTFRCDCVIPAGNFTIGDLKKTIPAQNKLVVIKCTGN